jgi:diguanylate cyclase (GGDEF)-like protein
MTVRRMPGARTTTAPRAFSRVRDWQLWSVAEPLRSYLVAVPMAALVAIGWTASDTRWQGRQLLIFAALLGCSAAAVEATRTVKEPQGTFARDLQSIWYLATAVILTPFYAFAAPVALTVYKLFRTPSVVIHRRIFSNATISLAYGSASLLFHATPLGIAGVHPGTRNHALTWTVMVVACGLVGWVINHGLLLVGIKLSDPQARVRELVGSRESVTSDCIELSLATFVTLVVAINAWLMALALPTVIMQRRYLMRAQLVTNARIDAETGLLNATTWQREATAELLRALRSRTPLAVAMVAIDHFKDMNETAGPSVRNQLIRDIAGIIRDQLPGHDLVGRYSGEEFAILLPQTDREEARRISERLRDHIAGEPIAIESGTHAGYVFRLTVSIGVAAMNESQRALTELIGAADSALDQATRTGWSKVYVLPEGTVGRDS